MSNKALLASVLVAAAASLALAQDKRKGGPEPETMMCASTMDYTQETYSAVPLVGGLSRVVIDGKATINCPGKDPITMKIEGSGVQAGLQLPSGENPILHKGNKLSGHFNIRVPSLVTARDLEGTYFYTGANTPIGGVETSPFMNTSGDVDTVLYMPTDFNVSAGATLKVLKLKQ